MRVLVTGSSGEVGRAVVARLAAEGDDVLPFDLADGRDVLDLAGLGREAAVCDQIVHLAAVFDPVDGDVAPELLPPSQGSPARVVEVSVVGTWNVLEAARAAGHERVVVMSSVDVLGVFKGERPPDYLPIDADHPTRPTTPYGLAKLTADRICASFSEATGIATPCLRAPGVWNDEIFDFIRRRWSQDPRNDRRPFWEYGAFVALEDLAEAVLRASRQPFQGHAALLVSSDDAALAEQSSREAARSIHPEVRWRGGAEFERDPWRTLVDNEPAKRLLGWQPRVRFRPGLG